ncbi:hypothetical protein CAJCM15448_50700 [Candidozyma auris]|nr:hypothetical protein CAJCM15448_50700 [[Candida] auris]
MKPAPISACSEIDEFTISLSINHDVYDPVDVVDEYFERLGVEKVDLSDRIIDLNKRNCANFESLSKISPKEVFAPGNNSTNIESLSKFPPGERGAFEKNHENLESLSRISPIEEDASEKNCANLDSPREISSEEADSSTITVKKSKCFAITARGKVIARQHVGSNIHTLGNLSKCKRERFPLIRRTAENTSQRDM